ncbi:MAG: hypothetical protein JXB49_18265 [Bacteroidales bacterium]|nr:hypothetical protein [Bacteroidales bacterium]
MKQINLILSQFLIISIISCSTPASKESYLKKFESFINEVEIEYHEYNGEDWDKADKKYQRFSENWYDKFKEDLTTSEKLTVMGFESRYYLYKAAYSAKDYFDSYLEEDYIKLREKVRYYIENDLDDDLNSLIEKAKETSDTAFQVLDKIIQDFEK